MKAYLDILRNIIENGIDKSPTRRNPTTNEVEVVDGGVKTIGLPNLVFSHNMKDGFPLATCRKMPFKSMSVELEGFIRGITDKHWYKERGCKFWDQWCNPRLIPEYIDDNGKPAERKISDKLDEEDIERFLLSGRYRKATWAEKKAYMVNENDLGPIYGSQWRTFNGESETGDQLADIVDKLVISPNDRRMVCSAWNPNEFSRMALVPCHVIWGVTVYGNTLNLWWAQRSVDSILGLPNNIASYGLLLELLAATSGFTPGNLTGLLIDCHIYESHIESAKELIKREPRTLPNIKLTNNSGPLRPKIHIADWTYQDVELLNYNPHEAMKFAPVVV